LAYFDNSLTRALIHLFPEIELDELKFPVLPSIYSFARKMGTRKRGKREKESGKKEKGRKKGERRKEKEERRKKKGERRKEKG
jgi:hypothetical protein